MNRAARLLVVVLVATACGSFSALASPDPIAWWKLDEGTGTTVADSSGNGHNGTFQNSPTWTSGALSNAVQFSMTNIDLVNVSASSAFNLSNAMSVAVWIRLTDPWTGGAGSRYIIYNDGYYGGWGLLYDSGGAFTFMMTGANGNAIATAAIPPTNLWTHLVATFDGTTARVYVNGLLNNMSTWSGARLGNTNHVAFGDLPGALDDVRIYTNALTESQIVQIYALGDHDLDRLADVDEVRLGTDPNNPDTDGDGFPDGMEVAAGTDTLNASSHPDTTSGLVGRWKLDEGAGTITADATTNGNTGTLSSGSLWASGIMSNAVSFDGVNDYVTCGPSGTNTPLAIATNAITIAFWAYVTNQVQSVSLAAVIARREFYPIDAGYLVWWDSTYSRIVLTLDGVDFDDWNYCTIPFDSFAANTWNHFAFSYDGSNMVAYVNGAVLRSTAASNSITASSLSLYLAQDSFFGSRWNGRLDDVRIYNRGLSAGDVAALALVDTDGDGLPNVQEMRLGTNPNNSDTDGDGIPDGWEVAHGLNPLDPSDAAQTSAEPFAHGLSNLQVYQHPSVLIADNYSTLADGIPDWWKVKYGFSITDTNVASADPDGDGQTNLQEYDNGTNPTNYYNGVLPGLSIVSGNGQTWLTNQFLPQPLVVLVVDTNNVALTNAPVTFAVSVGSGHVAGSTNASPVTSLVVRTGTNGQAAAYFLLPGTFDTTNQITVTATTDASSTQVVFTAQAYSYTLDTDGDGIPDWWEIAHGLNPLSTIRSADGSNLFLVGWWKLNEASGTNVANSTGITDGSGGAININTNADHVSGVYSNSHALQFNGTNSSVFIPSVPVFVATNANGDFSISLWMNRELPVVANQTVQRIISHGLPNNCAFWLEADSSDGPNYTIKFAESINGQVNFLFYATGVDGNILMTTGVWYHVAASYHFIGTDGNHNSIMNLYINGVLAGSTQTAIGKARISNDDFILGASDPNGSGDMFKGRLEDVRYNTAYLSAEDLTELVQDPDNDGLNNLQEYLHGTDPHNPTSNGDGIPDGVAVALGISPTNLDLDGDGLFNAQEIALGLNPLLSDWQPPPSNPSDHTHPTITLNQPTNAVQQ